MIIENLSTLKINKMTQAQYDRELAAGNISATELYLTPDSAASDGLDGISIWAVDANSIAQGDTSINIVDIPVPSDYKVKVGDLLLIGSELTRITSINSGVATFEYCNINLKGQDGNDGYGIFQITGTPTPGKDDDYEISINGIATNGKQIKIGDYLLNNTELLIINSISSTKVSAEIVVSLRGADGKSAYKYAQEAGYTGTESEFAEKLADTPVSVHNSSASAHMDIREQIGKLSSEKANSADVVTLSTTVSEIDNALFERTNGTSIYDPDTMYVTDVMLNIRDDLVGTKCIDSTSTWDGITMSATTKLVCEPNQKYVLIGADGNTANSYAVGIYDANGVLLKWYSNSKDVFIATPSTAYYMRVCFAHEAQREGVRSIQYYEESKTFYGYVVGEYPRIVEKFVTKPTRKPIVIIMHDGGNYDNRAEILAEYGLHGTFCVNSDSIAYMDEEFKKLLTQGHDVALYGGLGTQPSTYVTGTNDKAAWYNYIKGGLDALAAKGVYLPTQYGCRGHKGSKYITEVCQELGFKYISCTYELHSGETMDNDTDIEWVSTYENDPDNPLFSPSILSEDVNANRAFVDNAIENNYIVGLFTHNVEDTITVSYNLSTTAYRDILSYVKEKVDAREVEALTMREFYNKYHDWDGQQRDYARAMGVGSYGTNGSGGTGDLSSETWTFELEDGTIVTKRVAIV